jgi:hypothetical protein
LGSLSTVRTTCHPVWTPICPLFHPSRRRVIPSRRHDKSSIICPDDVHSRPDLHCFEKLLFQLASVRTFQQPIWMPLSVRSASDSFQVQFKGRLLQPSGRRGFSSGGSHTKGKNHNLNITVRTIVSLSPDAHPPWSGRVKALYGNYLQQTSDHLDDSVSPSGRQCLTVWTQLLNRKDFSAKFLEKSVPQLSVRTAHVHRPDGTRIYHCSRPFCTSAYK